MEINIRKLTIPDIKPAAKIFTDSFNSVGEKWSLETAEKRLEQYFNPESCWVAEIDSEIVGVLTSKIDNVLDHQELYIDIIAVEPKLHKSGVGNILLQTAENYAKINNYKAVWLIASSEIPSYNWYIKTGFTETSWKTLVKEF